MVMNTLSHRFWQVFTQIACLMLFASSANAVLTASVDRTVVSKNDIIQLTIRSDKGPIEHTDFSALEKNFSVINRQRSNQISIINGNQQAIYDLRLALFPIDEGLFTIPAFKSQDETSQPIEIKVAASAAGSSQTNTEVFLKTEVSKQHVYVQEQFLFTLRLYHAVGLIEAQLTPLKIDNAVVETLGEQKKHQTVSNGIRYSVIEQQYSIIPEKSGQLSIPQLTFTGRSANRSVYGQSNQYLRTRSETHTIKVLPKPADYPAGEPWLPTSALYIADSWRDSTPTLTVGEPVTRTLTVTALNLDAAQLPDIKLPSVTNLKMYPDQAQNENNITAAGLVGQRSFSTAILPTQAGDIEIPAIKVVWWNTDRQQLEETLIPAKTLSVQAAAYSDNQIPAAALKTIPVVTSTAETSNIQQSIVDNNNRGIWPYLTLLFVLLWLVTGFMWWRTKQKTALANNAEVAEFKPLHINQNSKAVYKDFKKSCQNNKPETARKALLDWFRLQYQQPNVPQLSDVTLHYQDTELEHIIRTLESHLYGTEQSPSSWQGTTLLTAIGRLEKTQKQQLKNSPNNSLKPLYPF